MLLRYLGRWLDARDQHMAVRGEYTYQGHQEASMENTSPRAPAYILAQEQTYRCKYVRHNDVSTWLYVDVLID